MLILVPKSTPRVHYTMDFVFGEIIGISYELTDSIADFQNSTDLIKWSYGVYLEEYLVLPAHSLLFETDIKPLDLHKIIFQDLIVLFKTEHKIEGIQFDVFSSIFYLISRYEEYLPSVHDSHGRYASFQSTAVSFGFLDIPMVNRYIFWIINWLKSHFINIKMQYLPSQVQFTFDIDHPFYLEGVTLKKYIARSIKNLFSDIENDPFDTFQFIETTLGEYKPIYFVLCPKNPAKNDHFQKREHPQFQQLISSLASKFSIGIHPSYSSIENKLIDEELNWLQKLTSKKITKNRFHYLKFTIENLYNSLKKTTIVEDYSMAYGNISGFRTSTSFPFYLYDLVKNKKTSIRIWTPCIMDSSFQYAESADKINLFDTKVSIYISEIKKYGGCFIPIFHNDILSKDEWKKAFKDTVEKTKNEL